jgi:hypothetical protein
MATDTAILATPEGASAKSETGLAPPPAASPNQPGGATNNTGAANATPASPQTPTSPNQPGGGTDNTGATNWDTPRPASPKWTIWHTLGLLLIVVIIGLVGLTQPPLVSFLTIMGLMAAFTTIAGHAVMGIWWGLLIDPRNKMSLSRLQMLTWTIVVLSGFLAAALWNTKGASNKDPLSVEVPQELWLLMGISTISLIGSPLIRNSKTIEPPNSGKPPSDAEKKEMDRLKEELARQNIPDSKIDTQGKIVIWKWPADARLADLFQGDEVGNAAHLDLGKIQMFFFTLILVLTYTVALSRLFINPSSFISALPPVGGGMVALLGISHAGFLMNSAVPHSVSR